MPPKLIDTGIRAGIECFSGGEVEAKFASEPLAEGTSKEACSVSINRAVQSSAEKLDAASGLSSSVNVDCSAGGGNILVFRRSANDPKASTSKFIRHDSYPTASHSTLKPPRASPGASSPKPTTGIFRRIAFAGTATAASSYRMVQFMVF
ncbi:hypothetical protein PENDEC_c014G06440 [Penicillium decumbens]|uniref:Uncharacterized protein n=1 Tax=Penicillium decumbens TaxID=69771 RepID=A0A1V6P9T7_PENDC|nr:hypothetical protein PENDEC_c014G06440 [Penicillium decumbens]